MSDIPRFSTALAEWCACMMFCYVLPVRMPRAKFLFRSAVFLVFLTSFLVLTDNTPNILWLIFLMTAFLSMFLFLKTATGLSLYSAGYFTMRAIVLAEFAASLEWQLHYFLFGERVAFLSSKFFLSLLHLLITYILIFGLAAYIEKKLLSGTDLTEHTLRDFLGAFLITAATLSLSNLSFLTQNTPFSTGVARDIFNIRTLVDLGGLAILYAFQSRITELQAQQELQMVRASLGAQYDSYRNYQESIELVNIKYHDLKHQLAGLRSMEEKGERMAYIDAMEKELEEFRPAQQTGSSVLDTILSGKAVRCAKNNIKLTVVADGALLSFLHVTDICSIFGNALDNAIECVAKVEDPQKRLIHLVVAARKNFLLIEILNYCEEPVEMKDGMPVSAKSDGRIHGYGAKSMRYAVEKYGGTILFIQEDETTFCVRIMIPLPESSAV